jgi:hypothetical protein
VKTNLEMFDYIANHLLTQNAKSKLDKKEDGFDVCRYRSGKGRTCAVGCLIPINKYSIDLEGHDVEGTKISVFLGDILDFTFSITLLKLLQLIHDRLPPSAWKSELATLRERVVHGEFD